MLKSCHHTFLTGSVYHKTYCPREFGIVLFLMLALLFVSRRIDLNNCYSIFKFSHSTSLLMDRVSHQSKTAFFFMLPMCVVWTVDFFMRAFVALFCWKTGLLHMNLDLQNLDAALLFYLLSPCLTTNKKKTYLCIMLMCSFECWLFVLCLMGDAQKKLKLIFKKLK